MFNPFTSIPAVCKLISESNKYLKNIPAFEALRKEGDVLAEQALILEKSGEWASTLSEKLCVTYEIVGEENIPDHGPIVVYANHQGLADILAIYYLFRNHFQLGFIAKEEWRKVGFLRDGIIYTRSLFLKRGDSRSAIKTLREACELLEQGFSLMVFPEGTRSRGPVPGPFKHGAFKFAQKSKVPVLPISLEGSYHIFEEFGTFRKCHIKIKVHPLVHIENMNRQEQTEAFAQIEETIKTGWAE